MKTHYFIDSGEAYDRCQTSMRVAYGDTLVCQTDKVVGVAHVWPVAVTVEKGELHGVSDLAAWFDNTDITQEQVAAAVKMARSLGLPVDPMFAEPNTDLWLRS